MILDSDVVIEILERNSAKGDEAVKRILSADEQPCITTISMHEVLVCIYRSGGPFSEFLQFPVIDFAKKDALLSSKLEFEAEKIGKPALRSDAMIAAIAINHGLSVYTFNTKHFAAFKPQGLKLFIE